MLKKIAFVFVAFAQIADAQNSGIAHPSGASKFQELLKAPRSTESATGTVSASNLKHRVPKEARSIYERALKTARRDARNDVEAAALDLERAVTIDPEFTDAHGQLGFLCFRLERFAEAA